VQAAQQLSDREVSDMSDRKRTRIHADEDELWTEVRSVLRHQAPDRHRDVALTAVRCASITADLDRLVRLAGTGASGIS
jgi:hypothetical protein